MRPWSSPTPPRCRQRFMLTKAWHRCCSLSRTRFAKSPTRIGVASTRDSAALHSRKHELNWHVSVGPESRRPMDKFVPAFLHADEPSRSGSASARWPHLWMSCHNMLHSVLLFRWYVEDQHVLAARQRFVEALELSMGALKADQATLPGAKTQRIMDKNIT